jgi:hypothetical protein
MCERCNVLAYCCIVIAYKDKSFACVELQKRVGEM